MTLKEGSGDRNRIKKILMQYRNTEPMQQNVSEAHVRASDTLRRLFQEIEFFMHSLDQESGTPQNISDKFGR